MLHTQRGKASENSLGTPVKIPPLEIVRASVSLKPFYTRENA